MDFLDVIQSTASGRSQLRKFDMISDRGGGPRLPREEVDARCCECDAKIVRAVETVSGILETCNEVEVVSGEDGETWKACIYDVRVCPRGKER